MEFQKGRYVLGMWFITDKRDQDWLAHVYRDGDGPWHLEYRFRYYSAESKNPFDGKDEKSHYAFVIRGEKTEADVLDTLRTLILPVIFRFTATAPGGLPFFREVLFRTDDPPTILAALAKEPFCHIGHQHPLTGEAEPLPKA